MIDITQEGDITILTINNPPMNVLCSALLKELDAALDTVKGDASKAIILTGEGKAFVAGADIKEMMDMGASQAKEFALLGQGVFSKLENFHKPIIAAVNGYALGGGMEIAMSCDFIIASEKAKFGQPEVSLGVIPGFGGTQRLPRIVTPRMAKQLIFTGDIIAASEAERIGLANHVIAPEELMSFCRDMAGKVAQKGPVAIQLAKDSINRGINRTQDDGLALEAEAFSKCFATQDQTEGMTAFVEKRPPNFKGE
jgi:enoyl-CoA hydratase